VNHHNYIHVFSGCAECIPQWVIILLVAVAFLAGYWAGSLDSRAKEQTGE